MSRVIAIATIWLLIACLRTDEFKSTWRQFERITPRADTGKVFDDCVGICRIIGSIWEYAFDSDEVVSSSRKDIRTESPGPHERKISELREILDELDNAEGMLDDAEVSHGKACSPLLSGIIWQVNCRMFLIRTKGSPSLRRSFRQHG